MATPRKPRTTFRKRPTIKHRQGLHRCLYCDATIPERRHICVGCERKMHTPRVSSREMESEYRRRLGY